MDTTIYYFTGTGNSLVAARMLQSNLPDSKLIPIAGMMLKGEKAIASMNSVVGVVYPMYCGVLPNIVQRFFANSDFTKAKYVFTVITEGGKTNGNPEKNTRLACMSSGHDLNGSWWVQMPDNYIPLSNAIPKEEQDRLTEEASVKIKSISKSVLEFEHVIEKEKVGGKFIRAASGSFLKHVADFGSKLNVTDDCVKCGTCVKVCPVDNITLSDKPVWNHHCEGCLACLQFCPKGAIVYKNKADRKRYHHCEVSVQDMEAQKQSPS